MRNSTSTTIGLNGIGEDSDSSQKRETGELKGSRCRVNLSSHSWIFCTIHCAPITEILLEINFDRKVTTDSD